MTGRPFRVLGVQQIAIGGLDRAALHGLFHVVRPIDPDPGSRAGVTGGTART